MFPQRLPSPELILVSFGVRGRPALLSFNGLCPRLAAVILGISPPKGSREKVKRRPLRAFRPIRLVFLMTKSTYLYRSGCGYD
jgi:hypothetical protein